MHYAISNAVAVDFADFTKANFVIPLSWILTLIHHEHQCLLTTDTIILNRITVISHFAKCKNVSNKNHNQI